MEAFDMDKNNIIKETAGDNIYTYKDYLSWDDGKRYELIDGKVYMMTPAPSRVHQKVSMELSRQIATYLLDKSCEVYSAPIDVRLVEGEEKDKDISTVVQPDIVLVCDKNKLDEHGCKGAPDLIIEILSPFSKERDRKIKKDLYEKHGVREYWLVDYNKKTVTVYLLNDNNSYGEPVLYSNIAKVKTDILKNLEIDLSLVFRE